MALSRHLFDKDDFYITINSNAQQDIFPNNKPYQFIVTLPETLDLSQQWRVGLVDIVWNNNFASSEQGILRMFVESSIVTPSIVTENKRSVLATVPILSNRNQRMYYEPYSKRYIKVSNVQQLREIDINIRNELGDLITTINRDLSITLHFKKV